MKLLTEYLEHAISFEPMAAEESNPGPNSKNRRQPIGSSLPNVRQNTASRPQAFLNRNPIRAPGLGLKGSGRWVSNIEQRFAVGWSRFSPWHDATHGGPRLPEYFFAVRRGDCTSQHSDGIEFPDMGAVLRELTQSTGELLEI
jgi:hypothetical protein